MLELGHPSSPALGHQHSWFLGLCTCIVSPCFQALGSELELHQWLSRVFSYRQQIVGLLSLYMSQSLIINLFLFIYLSIYLIGFICLENSNTIWKGGSIRRKFVVVQISR